MHKHGGRVPKPRESVPEFQMNQEVRVLILCSNPDLDIGVNVPIPGIIKGMRECITEPGSFDYLVALQTPGHGPAIGTAKTWAYQCSVLPA